MNTFLAVLEEDPKIDYRYNIINGIISVGFLLEFIQRQVGK